MKSAKNPDTIKSVLSQGVLAERTQPIAFTPALGLDRGEAIASTGLALFDRMLYTKAENCADL